MLSLASLSLLVFPLLAAATNVPAGVSTTLVPFGTLPECAQQCGPLYDAQGACGQTALTSTSVSCFCAYPSLQGFKTSPTGVCPTACATSANPAGDESQIQSWFNSFCASGGSTTSGPPGATGTGAPSATGTSAPAVPDTDNITWIGSHWKYVILLVVVILLIAIMWVGACILRRRYVKRRDRAFEMRPPAVPWGPHQTQAMTTPGVNYGDGVVDSGRVSSAKGFYGGKGKSPLSNELPVSEVQPMSSVFEDDNTGMKKDRRWIPKERT